MTNQKPSRRRKIGEVAEVLIFNIALWVAVPDYVGGNLKSQVPATPLASPEFVIIFGVLITALQVIVTVAEGRLAIPFMSASSIVIAFYVWAAFDGGNIVYISGPTTVILNFPLLVYILIIPVIWGAIRAPLSYLATRKGDEGPIPTAP